MTGPPQAAERRTRDRQAREQSRSDTADPGTPSPGRRPSLPGRRTWLVLGALTLALAAFGVWVFYGSGWLRLENVSVTGTRVLTERRVRAVADVPLGTPLVSLDEGAVERRVRKTLRRVEDVRVARSWPHGVKVHVTERRPVLLLRRGGEKPRYVEVDAEGVRFATVTEPPHGVPLLEVDPRGGGSGAGRTGPAALRRAAADVVTRLPGPVRRDTRTVRVVSYDDITLELTGGRTVRWGSPEQGDAKATALTAVMRAAQDADHFDVSAPSAPAASGS